MVNLISSQLTFRDLGSGITFAKVVPAFSDELGIMVIQVTR